MVHMLAGLITYILLAIYCHDQHHEKVSVKRLGKSPSISATK